MEKGKQISKRLPNLNDIESKELIKSLIHDALLDNGSGNLSIKEKLQLLKECKDSFNLKHSFKLGDIVKWKPYLKNRTIPDYEEPMIVLEILENPIFDKEEGPNSSYYNEPLDIILGIIDEEDEFISLHFDSRKIQPFKTK